MTINYIWSGKVMVNCFYEMGYFLTPYSHNKKKIKVELDLSNYAWISNMRVTS